MKSLLTVIMIGITVFSHAQNFYIAHRGASYDAPENTVASAKLAWEQGADAVEIDVYLASDNRIVVIHDKDTKRTTSGKNMVIKNTPSMVLRDLDVGSWKDPKFKGERIPFIEEIIATVPEGKTLVVEVKCGSEIVPHMERVLLKNPKKEQIMFISFGWETIVDLKKAFPGNKAYWLSDSRQEVRKHLDQIVPSGLDGINLNYSIIDEELVNEAKSKGFPVLAWTVNDPTEAKRLISIGVTHITTSRPQWLKEQVEGRPHY
jgi:glycerophosphoryl diester phosphodiesterase